MKILVFRKLQKHAELQQTYRQLLQQLEQQNPQDEQIIQEIREQAKEVIPE